MVCGEANWKEWRVVTRMLLFIKLEILLLVLKLSLKQQRQEIECVLFLFMQLTMRGLDLNNDKSR